MDKILEKLVSIPSVSGSSPPHEIVDYTFEFLKERGMHTRRFVFDGFPALMATTRRTRTPKLILAAHLDVVAGSEDLFMLRIKDGRYVGRGVFDMKLAAAAYLHLVDDLRDQLAQYDFGIMFTTDEEISGRGTGHLVDAGYMPEVCVLPDGGDNWHIETLAKGWIFRRITIFGTSAHGSRPWEGDSASMRLVELLAELMNKFESHQQPETETLNIGMIRSGQAVNQIPDSAIAEIDMRYMAPEDETRLLAMLDELCAKYGGAHEHIGGSAPVVNDFTNPYIAAYAKSITDVTGHIPEPSMSFGGSDARFFTDKGVPCIVSRPFGGGQHSETEWVDVEAYEQFKEVIRHYVDQVAHAPRLSVKTAQSMRR